MLVALVFVGCSHTSSSDAQLRHQLEGLKGGDSTESGDPRRGATVIEVVTTHPIIGDLVRFVGGTNVRVRDIVQAGLDPHTYRPTEADVETLSRARLVLRIDRGLDPWFGALATKAVSKATVIDVSAAVPARMLPNGVTDPYVWHDPANGDLMVAAITAALIAADPADAEPFRTVAARLTSRIDAAGVDIDRILGPVRGRSIVTTKATVGWMAARAGITVIGTVVPGSDSRSDLTTAHLTELRRTIESKDVKAVFGESTMPPGAAEGLAHDANVAFVGGPDALLGDTLGLAGGGADTYVTALVHNARELAAHA